MIRWISSTRPDKRIGRRTEELKNRLILNSMNVYRTEELTG